MVGCKDMFICLNALPKPIKVILPNGRVKEVKCAGKVKLLPDFEINEALLIPDFKHNLLSVSKLVEKHNIKVIFDANGCKIQDLTTKKEIGEGVLDNGIYKLRRKEENEVAQKRRDYYVMNNEHYVYGVNRSRNVEKELFLIHNRLGHISMSKMKHLSFCNVKNLKVYDCDILVVSKHHRLPLKPSKSITGKPLQLIHMDLWGPYKIRAITGEKYFLTIVDDFSRAIWTFLLLSKELVKTTLQHFLSYVENQFGFHVKTLRGDNGTEILQKDCSMILKEKGIIHQTSVPGVAAQNGRVEKKHKSLLEIARAIRLHANLPEYLWGECILLATHIINLLPSSVIGWKTPYERTFSKKPSYEHLRVIGCLCYASPTNKSSNKFDETAIRSILVGYPQGQKG
ncbi:Retrovirus-related Pol polyprotein from transposon TNT 1-94 [Bienertia sinuspersici]